MASKASSASGFGEKLICATFEMASEAAVDFTAGMFRSLSGSKSSPGMQAKAGKSSGPAATPD